MRALRKKQTPHKTMTRSAEAEEYLRRSAERAKLRAERDAAIKVVAAELRERLFREELAKLRGE